MFKNQLATYWHLLKGVLTVFKLMAFERFTALFFSFYILFALSVALVLSVLHWGVGIGCVLISLMLFTRVLDNVQFLKRALIAKGDRVEYADPNEHEDTKIFKKAEVVLKMRFEEAEKSKLISKELMQDNQHFYLVKRGKEVSVIAFDWIIGLAPEVLDIEFTEVA